MRFEVRVHIGVFGGTGIVIGLQVSTKYGPENACAGTVVVLFAEVEDLVAGRVLRPQKGSEYTFPKNIFSRIKSLREA